MAISKTRAEFECDIETVWDTVTSLTDYTWRSDVKKIRELRTKGHFIEYRKNGIATKFSTTKFEPLSLYELDMENKNLTGHWQGVFSYQNGITVLELSESVKARNIFMRPFMKLYLKNKQKNYIAYLQKELEALEKEEKGTVQMTYFPEK